MARPANGRARLMAQRMLPLQDGLCWWHGGPIEGAAGQEGVPTIEHLQHVSDGGNNHISNIVIACRACNSARANRKGWVMHANLANTPRARFLETGTLHDFQIAMKWAPRSQWLLAQHNSHVREWKAWLYRDAPKKLPRHMVCETEPV